MPPIKNGRGDTRGGGWIAKIGMLRATRTIRCAYPVSVPKFSQTRNETRLCCADLRPGFDGILSIILHEGLFVETRRPEVQGAGFHEWKPNAHVAYCALAARAIPQLHHVWITILDQESSDIPSVFLGKISKPYRTQVRKRIFPSC